MVHSAQKFARPATRFVRDEGGVTAMIFAITVFAVVAAMGAAIDLGRAVHANEKITVALDAAALATAKTLRERAPSNGELIALARRYFDENMQGSGGAYATVKDFAVSIDHNRNSVTITTTADVATVFTQVLGLDKVTVPRSATATYNMKDLEVGLALDITGSMSGTKIADLKHAASEFADILLKDAQPGRKIRIGLAPYSATVNLGTYAGIATNGRSADRCAIERLIANPDIEDAPAAGRYFGVRGDLNSGANPAYGCPRSPVLPLSDDLSTIKSRIDAFSAGGRTAGHLGAQWGWYLVSPEWSSVWPSASRPAPYSEVDDNRLIKAVMLMTDGEFNTSYTGATPDGAQTAESMRHARAICQAMKDKSIVVWSVGFQLTDASARSVLTDCASNDKNGAKFVKFAEDRADLTTAFTDFARFLSSLRLAN